MRNFEYKEGYYDELMALIIEGLKKAKKVLNDEEFERKVVRMVKHHLRTVLSSIYLIKMSERKMMDFDRAWWVGMWWGWGFGMWDVGNLINLCFKSL